MLGIPPDRSVTLAGIVRGRQLYRFVRWLLIGFVLAIGSVSVLGGVSAQSTPALNEFDPDTFPAIDIGHAAPVLLRTDQTVSLEFMFACGFALPMDAECVPQATLFVAHGAKGQFAPVKLTEEYRDSLRVLSARVRAVDNRGQALQYYLDVREEASGVRQRYPSTGAIEPTVLSEYTNVQLGAGKETSPEIVLRLPWGNGPKAVGIDQHPEQATVSADAFDVAPDGTLALLDEVNARVVVVDPEAKTFRSHAIPVQGVGDVRIDARGQVTVLDLVGKRAENSKARIPQLYTVGADGKLKTTAPVYTLRPYRLTDDATVIDMVAQQEVLALDTAGQPRSREEQRGSRIRTPLLVQFLDEHQVRFADMRHRLAFELRSGRTIGPISHFGRTANGYVAVFERQNFRVVWFDARGTVLNDVLVPNNHYSIFNPNGRVGVDKTGAVYLLGSTSNGIEIYRVPGPAEVQS